MAGPGLTPPAGGGPGRSVDELLAAAAQRSAAVAAAGAALAAVREVGRSDDGEVRAVVDGDGALVELWLAPGTTRLPGAHLGQLVVLACARAAERAEQRGRTIRARCSGDVVAAEWDRVRTRSPAAAAGGDPVGDRLARAPAGPTAPPTPREGPGRDGPDELADFDFSTLRSDRGR